MRYLVATDGSTVSDNAVEYATRQALAVDAVLEIVHVLTPETKLIDGEVIMSGEEAAIEQGQQTLRETRDLVIEIALDREADLQVETQLLTGQPAEAITDHAETMNADAIYVGHRGFSSERERVAGSVAKSVVDKATVPVTIIK